MRRFTGFRCAFAAAAAAVFFATAIGSPAQESKPPGHISAVAQGTSTQLGQMVNVNIIIREYSTPEEQKALIEAFQQGGGKGLARALSKMSSKGRMAITGTLGYDINYIRLIETPQGRTIRFVTDRPLRMGEKWHDTRSADYDLSAGEIVLSGEKGKASGTLLPACQFKLDKENQLEIELRRNAWKLVNVSIDD